MWEISHSDGDHEGDNHEKGSHITLCATINCVDQLFSLGHVSSAAKIRQVTE
jgi:hypothetical protein